MNYLCFYTQTCCLAADIIHKSLHIRSKHYKMFSMCYLYPVSKDYISSKNIAVVTLFKYSNILNRKQTGHYSSYLYRLCQNVCQRMVVGKQNAEVLLIRQLQILAARMYISMAPGINWQANDQNCVYQHAAIDFSILFQ